MNGVRVMSHKRPRRHWIRRRRIVCLARADPPGAGHNVEVALDVVKVRAAVIARQPLGEPDIQPRLRRIANKIHMTLTTRPSHFMSVGSTKVTCVGSGG